MHNEWEHNGHFCCFIIFPFLPRPAPPHPTIIALVFPSIPLVLLSPL